MIGKIILYLYLADSILIEQGNSKRIIIINPAIRSLARSYEESPPTVTAYYRGLIIKIDYDLKYNLWLAKIKEEDPTSNCKIIIRYLVPFVDFLSTIANFTLRQICTDKIRDFIKPYYYIATNTFEGRFSRYILLRAQGFKYRLSSIIKRIFKNESINIINSMFSSQEFKYDLLMSYFLARELIPIQLNPLFLDSTFKHFEIHYRGKKIIQPVDPKILVTIKRIIAIREHKNKSLKEDDISRSIKNQIKKLFDEIKNNFYLY